MSLCVQEQSELRPKRFVNAICVSQREKKSKNEKRKEWNHPEMEMERDSNVALVEMQVNN